MPGKLEYTKPKKSAKSKKKNIAQTGTKMARIKQNGIKVLSQKLEH
uniref:Uncharacterized protein n=1 Tax=Ciona intestinalis TaxID=7719 RepID=H2Y112_CIOIN